MTAFEGFSVSLARTLFFSKQECKIVNVARGDPKWEKSRLLACVLSWELFVIFLLLSALGHFHWIDKYGQK